MQKAKPKPKQPPARVLIVDDHPIFRHGLRGLIDQEEDLRVCGEAGNTRQAFELSEKTQPDVVIVDISLGDECGIDLIKGLKSRDDQVKMLVISMHDELLYSERSLRAGAMGYLNKHEAIDKTIEAIRRVLDGKIYLSNQMADRALQRFVGENGKGSNSPVDALTDRELQVFKLIGKGLTTQQITEKLSVGTKTIETYRHRIRAKLDLRNSSELTVKAAQWHFLQK
jgi:DNA-binding NarL/FixJ family response regulator